ncbi:MAG: HD domain-containing protein, partial [Rhodocyclaceae bacterium]
EVDRLFGVPQPLQYHPEGDTGVHVLMVLDRAAADGLALPGRLACLLHDLGKGDTPADVLPHHYRHEAASERLARDVCQRLKCPVDCRDLALMMAREHGIVHQGQVLRAETVVKLIERCDGLRRPERFVALLDACACDYRGRSTYEERPYPQRERLLVALAAVRGVDAGAIARGVADKARIPVEVHAARVAAVRQLEGRGVSERDAVGDAGEGRGVCPEETR